MKIDAHSPLEVEWDQYVHRLYSECRPRHIKKGLNTGLIGQIDDYLEGSSDFGDCDHYIAIHMDLHFWNLLSTKETGDEVTGVIDFGDAIVGKSRLLEIITPILTLAQGNRQLIDLLLESYSLLDIELQFLQKEIMKAVILRPACDLNFIMDLIP